MDPLLERARTIQAELDAHSEHIKRLEEDNCWWQERNNLLTKVCLSIHFVVVTDGHCATAVRSCGSH